MRGVVRGAWLALAAAGAIALAAAAALSHAAHAKTTDPTLPDPSLTPGVARPVTLAEVCRSGSSSDARHVTAAMKREVYRRYGLAGGNYTGWCRGPEGCEVDHLLSLSLGGSNVIENLWPEPFGGTPWNAHTKDRLENWLHAEVCAGRMDLATAQAEIRTNWIASFRRHLAKP